MSKTIKSEIVTINAEKAATLLDANTGNRKLSQNNLSAIKASLQRGEWKLNGEAVKISDTGKILDGQHRLVACVETGISFQTLIVYNVPDETQVTMDSGKSRTHADVLTLAGYTNAISLAATALAVVRTEQYSLRAALATGAAYPVTRNQILERVKAEPNLIEVAQYGKKFSRIGLAGRLASLMFYELSKIDSQDAQHFFEKLRTGDSLERGNPILTLRNQLLTVKDNQRGATNQTYIAALIIKAWNKFRAGDQCLQLKFVVGGASPDKFPEAI